MIYEELVQMSAIPSAGVHVGLAYIVKQRAITYSQALFLVLEVV